MCLGSTAHIIVFASNHLMREFYNRQCAVLLETARRERRNARHEEAAPRVMDEVDHKLNFKGLESDVRGYTLIEVGKRGFKFP